jgi:hypothetical protein
VNGAPPPAVPALDQREEALRQREEAVREREQAVQAQTAAVEAAQVQQQELRDANAHLVVAKLEADALKEAALLARKQQDGWCCATSACPA